MPSITSLSGLSSSKLDQLKMQYANANGMTYTNGKFMTSGSTDPINVSDTDLINYYNNNFGLGNRIKSIFENKYENLADTIRVGFGSFDRGDDSPLSNGINGAWKAAETKIEEVSPWGQAASTVMKDMDMGSSAMGALGLSSEGNTTIGELSNSTPGRYLLGWQNIYKRKADDFAVDLDTIKNVGGSYMGTLGDIKEASELAGGSYGILEGGGLNRANRKIAEAKRKQNIMSTISNEAKDQMGAVASMGDLMSGAYGFNTTGGYDQRYIRTFDEGGSTDDFVPQIICFHGEFQPEIIKYQTGGTMEFVPEIITTKFIPEIIDHRREFIPVIIAPHSINTFKAGGNIERQLDAPVIDESGQKNLIPEGSLHKNKHRMDNADNLTKKGIPVVSINGEQQAEIERNEIIFTKEVSDFLEQMCKIYFSEFSTTEEKEFAALEAGKLLTKEIMFNTDDRTGLIKSMKGGGRMNNDQKGGKIKKIDYEEWLKDFDEDAIMDLVSNYDLMSAFEMLPFEQMEKWKDAVLGKVSYDDDDISWHLPSVAPIDDDHYIFLKLGKSIKDNPELEGEFKWYNSNPWFSKSYKMEFDDGHNRWTYVKEETPDYYNEDTYLDDSRIPSRY